MWGIVPAAGEGSRIQPLAFSKELLPVGSRQDGEMERPRAVSEYLLERMILGGATKICFVISHGKSDILEYYGANYGDASLSYVVQPYPAGLCDALFRTLPLIEPHEKVLVGLPDTIWFPENGFCALPNDAFSFLLFPVEDPSFFDSVITGGRGQVLQIHSKTAGAASNWIWGGFKLSGAILQELSDLWRERGLHDKYLGPLVNEWLLRGGQARGIRAGESYVDVGTLHGYREAIQLLRHRTLSTISEKPGSRL